MELPRVLVDYPPWISELLDWERRLESDEDRMRLAIRVAQENVERGT